MSNSSKSKGKASSSRALQSASGAFGASTFGSNQSILSFVLEPLPLDKINDPNIVVEFKGLTKKDATTKIKALQQLKSLLDRQIEAGRVIEDTVLDAWVKIYPRLSIDNESRVRESSHRLHTVLLLQSSHARFLKDHAYSSIPCWLASQDDKQIWKEAQENIKTVIPTGPNKLLRKQQAVILEYALNAIQETPESLSDDRNVSPDDMQAKYHRVVGSALFLVTTLIDALDKEDLLKHEVEYEKFLSNEKVWLHISCEDAWLRQHVSLLAESCLHTPFIQDHLELMKNSFILVGLRSSQSMTATKFLEIVQNFCATYPDILASSNKDKKSILSRLEKFISKGSQDSRNFWPTLSSTLQGLPSAALPSGVEASISFMRSYYTGIDQRNDRLWNAEEGPSSYVDAAQFLFDRLENTADKSKFITVLEPIFEEYLFGTSHRKITKSRGKEGLDNFMVQFYSTDSELESYKDMARLPARAYKMVMVSANDLGNRLTNKFRDKIQLALPESSSEYHTSQNEVIQVGRRWFALFAAAAGQTIETPQQFHLLYLQSISIIETAMSTLIERKGKPYSAAAVIEAALIHLPQLANYSEVLKLLQEFITYYIGKLVVSPSSPFLVRILFLIGELQKSKDADLLTVWLNSVMNGVIDCPPGSAREQGAIALLSNFRAEHAHKFSGLQDFLIQTVINGEESDSGETFIIRTALETKCLSSTTATSIRDHLMGTLVGDDIVCLRGLKMLHIMAQSATGWESLDSDGKLVDLVVRLLKLSESQSLNQDISSEAIKLRELIWTKDESRQVTFSKATLKSLAFASPDTASFSTLVSVASQAFTAGGRNSIDWFFPDNLEWTNEIDLRSRQKINQATDVIGPLPGTMNLVNWPDSRIASTQTDSKGYSSLLRKTLYVSELFDCASPEKQKDILFNLGLMTEIEEDRGNLDFFEADSDWEIRNFLDEEMTRLLDLPSQIKSSQLGPGRILDETKIKGSKLGSLVDSYISHGSSNTPLSYYASKALCRLMENIRRSFSGTLKDVPFEINLEQLVDMNIFKAPANNVSSIAALLVGLEGGLASSQTVARLCKDVVADLISMGPHSTQLLPNLVLLNGCLRVYVGVKKLPVGEHRSMRAIEHILSWDLHSSRAGVAAESCRVLQQLFRFHPEHRATSALDFCLTIWSRLSTQSLLDDEIPILGTSLALCSTLKDTAELTVISDGNLTALQKHFKEMTPKIYTALLKFLKLERYRRHWPEEFVDDELLKLISRLDMRLHKEDPYDLYPLLNSNAPQVQSAAYLLLHRSLADRQIEVAVTSDSENSPPTSLEDELVSLVISAPNVSEDEVGDFAPPLRGFLLAWLLIFESFPVSTLSVRSGYIEHLKRERCINGLLPFLVVILSDKDSDDLLPLDKYHIDEKEIRSYDIRKAIDKQSAISEAKWMATHLYFLALNHTPYLVKSWLINEASRQTRIDLEKWTEKYISPLLISDALKEVETWAKDQSELQVRVSRTAREITAFYPIDESGITLVIRIPEIYTLGVAVVEAENSVIKAEKWNGILRTTKAVVEFSNKSLSDALDVFRRNIESAMNGVTECAICYSIVSADKKFPDKKCSTCSNKFHGQCLYKWFTTSNQNSCPLCRNQWSYGR